MPIRQGGMFANRVSTWPRDHFCRSTIAPRLSSPTMWNEFLPISMPITAIAVLGFIDMARSLSLTPLASFNRQWGRSAAGPFHYRPSAVKFFALRYFLVDLLVGAQQDRGRYLDA